jgi:SSS family solute:Na+ symporter
VGSLLRWADLGVVGAYLLALTSLGLGFARDQNTTEHYFLARRMIPAWAIGMSIVATLINSAMFVGYPGWPVPEWTAAGVVLLAGGVIVPFYRRAVGMSAYEYLGQRFGRPVRMYAGVAFALGQFVMMACALYLLATAVNGATGWRADRVIQIVGVMTILYTLLGGLEAVIWTSVVQGFVLWAGILIAAATQPKMRLGGPGLPLLIVYGFFWCLQKYTADQSIVQRYLAAKSDRAAVKGAAMGALLYAAIPALLMLAGMSARMLHKAAPHFRMAHLPPGAAGLTMAALLGSAMCALASFLNSFALVGVEDIYRQLRPEASDRVRLLLGKCLVLVCGAGCVAGALWLMHAKSPALQEEFTVSAAAGGGLAGLFVLAFLSRRASRRGVWAGIAASLALSPWMKPWSLLWPDYKIGAMAAATVVVMGYAASLVWPDPATGKVAGMTLWHWLRWRKTAPME